MAERCPECGFTYDLRLAQAAGDDIRAGVAEVAAVLRDGAVDARSRPRPEVWSPLGYGCHLRDVLLVQRERVLAARRADGADCAAMGREERVDHDGYDEQDPIDVARQLEDAAALFANVLARLGDGEWDRTVVYHYPRTQERSLRWLAVHTVHEARHHLLDIRRQVGAPAGVVPVAGLGDHAYRVRCRWQGSTGVGYRDYRREHQVSAPPAHDTLTLSADPAFLGTADRLNPEQLLVMAAASCQLLSFLAAAARARVDVLGYTDDAVGVMPAGTPPMRLSRIALRPRIVVAAGATAAQVRHLVAVAHRECYIANSLSADVTVAPQVEFRAIVDG